MTSDLSRRISGKLAKLTVKNARGKFEQSLSLQLEILPTYVITQIALLITFRKKGSGSVKLRTRHTSFLAIWGYIL